MAGRQAALHLPCPSSSSRFGCGRATGSVLKSVHNLAKRCNDTCWRAGELHNNVRMTWGKALLAWTASPFLALHTALHLNHLFALDGCDPASYSGVLWCLGLFDSPKSSESTPITGSLATRPTSTHARRLNPAAYKALSVA